MVKVVSDNQLQADIKALEKILVRLAKAGVKPVQAKAFFQTAFYKAYGPSVSRSAPKSEAELVEQRRIEKEAVAAEVEKMRRHAPLTWDEIKNLILPNGRRAGDCTMEEILASYKVTRKAWMRLAVLKIPAGYRLDDVRIDPLNAAQLFNGLKE